jgi:hypothetical protein
MSMPPRFGWRLTTTVGLGMVAAAVFLAAKDRPPAEGSLAATGAILTAAQPVLQVTDAEQRLLGTWVREQVAEGIRSRRLLRLEPDGAFLEQVRVVSATGDVSEHNHAGHWIWDGTNLKRKYTLMNGRPPSRLNVPFATFQIWFESRNEFIGVDHIHRNTVRYRRVAPETQL